MSLLLVTNSCRVSLLRAISWENYQRKRKIPLASAALECFSTSSNYPASLGDQIADHLKALLQVHIVTHFAVVLS